MLSVIYIYREVQGEFRQRVLTEIRATQRAVDKLREKAVQRYMRHTRQAQERRQKEKAYSSKVAKDALNLTKTASDKVAVKFQKDTKTWVTGLHDKCEAGKAAFNNSFEVKMYYYYCVVTSFPSFLGSQRRNQKSSFHHHL